MIINADKMHINSVLDKDANGVIDFNEFQVARVAVATREGEGEVY
jgi:hypothetical protein